MTDVDYVAAIRAHLAAQEEVKDALGDSDSWDTWLFQESLMVRVEQTSSCAVVLAHRGNWTAPNEHNTMRFPRLLTEFYADPERELGAVKDPLTAHDKIRAAHKAIDSHLHRPTGADVVWPDPADGMPTIAKVRFLRLSRLDELSWFPVPDGDGLVRAECYYAVGLG